MKRKLIRTSAVLLSIMLLVSGCGLSDPMYKNESSTTQETHQHKSLLIRKIILPESKIPAEKLHWQKMRSLAFRKP